MAFKHVGPSPKIGIEINQDQNFPNRVWFSIKSTSFLKNRGE